MKKESYIVGIVLFMLIFFGAFQLGFTEDEGYKVISTKDLKKRMESENKPLLVFALSPLEFSHQHIAGSTCIPLELMKNYYEMPENLGSPIVFYCYGPA